MTSNHEYVINLENDDQTKRAKLLLLVRQTAPHAWIENNSLRFRTDDQGKELVRIDTKRRVLRA
ncbi:MAG TPA: hypothetical protein VLH19_03610 [Patescibacteria group bacterium]|nr:hypothetical protein [Patescibacteria group bacterium]